jgi:hypothetical protein
VPIYVLFPHVRTVHTVHYYGYDLIVNIIVIGDYKILTKRVQSSGFNILYFGGGPTFRKKISPQFLGSKSKQTKKAEEEDGSFRYSQCSSWSPQ